MTSDMTSRWKTELWVLERDVARKRGRINELREMLEVFLGKDWDRRGGDER